MNTTQLESPPQRTARPRRSAGAILLEFLGSMNLAITLLVVIAIASVIGTVLQQHQPYPNYLSKFGPYWFEVFRTMGLYDVYGTNWFLVLLTFLLISTSVCIYRHAPQMVRDMRQFRLDVKAKSLRAFHHSDEWVEADATGQAAARGEQVLAAHGYKVRRKQHDDHIVLAGMKGGANRLGYIFSHLAIVIICIGALIDGNLPLKIAEWTGRVVVETRDVSAREMPPESVLSPDTAAFRGNIQIPEGSRADFVFLNVREGFLLQELPFAVELEEFRVTHHSTGQPKSFESDLVIHDPTLAEPLRRTISVNHPLIHRGYAIYQASFADGGSRLKMRAWFLDLPDPDPLPMEAAIYQHVELETPRGPMRLELLDYKPLNVFPSDDPDRQFQNFGPSVTFKLRNDAGEAIEYINYLAPVVVDNRPFMLSGMRHSEAEPHRYLYVPVDQNGGIGAFLELRRLAMNPGRVRAVVERELAEFLSGEGSASGLADSITGLVGLFNIGGMAAIMEQIQRDVPPEEHSRAIEAYMMMLQTVYGSLYLEQLQDAGVDLAEGVTEAQALWFEEALEAISGLGNYGSPIFLQFDDVEHIEASGLQIAKAPGQDIVYLGMLMLCVGVFLMFYVHHQRIWVWLSPENSGTRVLLAGSGNREREEFGAEFEGLKTVLRREHPSKESEV